MMICKKCFSEMVCVMSFSKNKKEKYFKCRKCLNETKHQKLNVLDLKRLDNSSLCTLKKYHKGCI